MSFCKIINMCVCAQCETYGWWWRKLEEVINKLQTNFNNAAASDFLCQIHKVRYCQKSKINKKDKDQHNEKETKTRMPKNGIATCL